MQPPSAPVVVPEKELTPEEKKKKELFDAFRFVGEERQKGFIKVYRSMIEGDKKEQQQAGKLSKCGSYLKKAIIGLIILAMVYPKLKQVTYKIAGWEMESDLTAQGASPFATEQRYDEQQYSHDGNDEVEEEQVAAPYDYESEYGDPTIEEEEKLLDRDEL